MVKIIRGFAGESLFGLTSSEMITRPEDGFSPVSYVSPGGGRLYVLVCRCHALRALRGLSTAKSHILLGCLALSKCSGHPRDAGFTPWVILTRIIVKSY